MATRSKAARRAPMANARTEKVKGYAGPYRKVSISLPDHLADFAEETARQMGASRSTFIASLLEREERARLEAVMIEGYKAMSAENLRDAEAALPAVAEVVLRDH